MRVTRALLGVNTEPSIDVVKLQSMADLGEIREAVAVARDVGARDIVLPHCTSTYPARVADTHPRTIPDLAQASDVASGLSDHTLGSAAAVALAALGAAVIEKHFTLSRGDGGADVTFSLEPNEFAQLAHDVRFAWDALGTVKYERKPSEIANLTFRRSLYAVRDTTEGEQLARMNIRAICPGHGLAPQYLDQVIGRRSRTRLFKGAALRWDLLV